MKVLGFDCAGGACSAAIVVEGRTIAVQSEIMERGQAEALLPMIEHVLGDAGLDLAMLDLLAVTTGPGSFTGLRTGLAAARGLALASGLPLIGVTSFETVAQAVAGERRGLPLIVALESRREELFLQRFDDLGGGTAALVPPDAWRSFVPAGAFIAAGDGARRLTADIERSDAEILAAAPVDAVHVARLGARRWQRGTCPPPPAPFYLRAPDTTTPAARR